MADLGNYQDKLIQDDDENKNGSSNITPTAGTSGVIDGSSSSGGVSTAGVGAGGTGGWTNIQAYLGANKSDNGSAQNLSEKAQGQYNTENQNLQTQAGNTKTQAESQAKSVKDAQDNSKQWVNQAANAYNYSGPQSEDYSNQTQKVKNALYNQYSGPNNFAYTTSNDFQRTNSALGDDNAFNSYMNDIYKQKAGGQLTSGQGALQTQLDVNNQNLADTRQNLLKQYAGFGDVVNNTAKETDAAIQSAKTAYGNNQEALKSSLYGMANDYESQQGKAEADARSSYNKDYTTGQSGLGNTWNGLWYDGAKTNALNNMGVGGDNLTWEAIQRENDFANQGKGIKTSNNSNTNDSVKQQYGYMAGGIPEFATRDSVLNRTYSDAKSNFDRNQQALNQFYTDQDAKYSNTADNEKRNWNTIMDILNNSSRKQQGFQVRG